MESDSNFIKNESLHFFSKIVASISHEIKNVMAIVNEKAGLLKDLSLIAQRGQPLDLIRIQTLAEQLKLQIKRGDTIIRNMNRFAHSVDEDYRDVDLNELTGLIMLLSERVASQMGLTLNLISPENTVTIKTQPFLLEFLLWNCIQFAMASCNNTGAVSIIIEKSDTTSIIKCLLKDGDFKKSPSTFPGFREQLLAKTLHADIIIDSKSRELSISLPEKIKL
jgi:signal transduction histidine kinase